MFQYLVLKYFIDIIALGFNYDVLKGLGNKPFHVFTDHVQMVNIPTQLSGSLIDYDQYQESFDEKIFCHCDCGKRLLLTS